MQKTISKTPKAVKKVISIPGDKSVSHRSIMFGAIAKGLTEVSNFLTGEDCICTMRAFQALGVNIQESGDKVIIEGKGFGALKAPEQEIYLGNSGTGMRLLAGLFSGLNFRTILTGDKSLSGRPMNRVIQPLTMMGANIESQNGGKAPLVINPLNQTPRLHGINYQSPIASAQVKSSILLAGLNAEGITTVSEPEKSRDHTERMLRYFGADLEINGLSVSLNGPNSRDNLSAQKINVPSDISSAAFFLVAGAILESAEIRLIQVGINPTRTGILDALKLMTVKFELENIDDTGAEPIADIVIFSSDIKAAVINGDLIPRLIDEIPVIAILASQASGTTIISDAEELRVKESDRVNTTINLLKALGIEVHEKPDGMIIQGQNKKPFNPPKTPWQDLSEHSYYVSDDKIVFDSHGDHRLAMSAAIAGLYSIKPIEILQVEFVNTSFPGFFEILQSIE
jgi:3-phosphoshikimate 1-carboxyvinyltransferase